MGDSSNDKGPGPGLHLVTAADREWLKQVVEEARYGTEPLTAEEQHWLDRVTKQMPLAQVACRQREVMNQAIRDWEDDLTRARRQGWVALAAGVLIGLGIGAVVWVVGSVGR